MSDTNYELNLTEIENQNMNTSLELFEILKQNAEEFCSYIKKYKECTAAYYDKLSKLTYNIKKDNISVNKNLNLSEIFSTLNNVPELVKQQTEGIKTFVDSLDLTIKPLENVLKNEINSLEEPKRIFEENKKKYLKNMVKHKKLMDSLSVTEKKIIKYYVSKKTKRDYTEEKNNMINNLLETKALEKDYLDGTNGGKNYHLLFQEDSIKNIEEIKSHIRMILENLNTRILFFLLIFNNCYSPCVNFVQTETQKNKTNPINTKNLINDNMIIHTYTLDELPKDKYIIKILNNPETKRLTYSIDVTNNQDNSKFSLNYFPNFTNILNFFIKESDDISDDIIFSNLNKIDLFGLAKKLYHNFKMVNKENYDIKSEEEKIATKNYTDKLILMKKFKSSNKKAEKITNEEKKKLFELVVKKENREIFLSRLNKIRSYGKFEYPKIIFDNILKIFLIILDQIEIDKDPFEFQFCIILSQTFFYLDNGKKEYIYKFIKSHKIFQSEEMWKKLIEFVIKEKSEQFNKIDYKIETSDENDENYKKRKNKIAEIVFAQILAITNNMCDFDFDLNKTEQIMNEYIKKYNLNESFEQIIMDIINNKKKEIKNSEQDKKE